MNEMEYNGLNTGLNSNPAGLYVYRKRQYLGNTTPAGVEHPMFIVHFYKHLMPPASLLPPEKSGQAVDFSQGEQEFGFIVVDFSQRKRDCLHANRASAPFNVAKAFGIHEFCKPSATRLPDGQEADGNKAEASIRNTG